VAGFRARPKQRGASQALFAPKLSDLYRGPGMSTCEESDSPPPSGGRLPPSYIPTLGALFPRGGPVQDPVLTFTLLCAPLLQAEPSALDPRFTRRTHPGGNPGENLNSISHRCYPVLVAFVWELTKENIFLPLGCLQGGVGENRRFGLYWSSAECGDLWYTEGFSTPRFATSTRRSTRSQPWGSSFYLT